MWRSAVTMDRNDADVNEGEGISLYDYCKQKKGQQQAKKHSFRSIQREIERDMRYLPR